MSRSVPALAAAALTLLALLYEPSSCLAALPDTYSGTGTSTKHGVSGTWLELPRAHAALSGDVRGSVRGRTPVRARIRLRRDHDDGPVILATLSLVLDIENRFTIPCGYFGRGGVYYIDLLEDEPSEETLDQNENFISSGGSDFLEDHESRIERESPNQVDSNQDDYDRKDNGNILNSNRDENKSDLKDNDFDGGGSTKSWRFDVLWPTSRLSVTPELIETYPERPVTAILEFPDAVCSPLDSNADFWLELLYCGHASGGAVLCDGRNVSSNAHVLYSEEVRGFPGRRTVSLRCELFGQAGDFALTLRPAAAAPPAVRATAFLKADWSQQFVLNVHARSVFPCAPGGVRALFQYPACVLERADRVRLFAREVTGYGGATAGSLQYVTERRVRRGQHAAAFDCELFQERFPEYCFVYVSQAVTGAVADVRMDCVPTMPLAEGSAGAWGPWSAWSSCPIGPACARATRSRHRFCDSPPPTYGAAFCQGTGVEVSACQCNGTSAFPLWGGVGGVAACRCGCVLHVSRTPRALAASTRACPGRTFWLLQAEWGHAIRLRVERAHLPCGAQWLRARAGDSLAAPLVAAWPRDIEADSNNDTTVEVSSVRYLLLEMYSDEVAAAGEFCAGGFIAHAQEIDAIPSNSSVAADRRWGGAGTGIGGLGGVGGAAQAAALALAAGAAAAAAALALHSAARTRHYKRAADKESLTDSDACSASMELVEQAEKGSRATLLSEMSAEIIPASRVCLRKLISGRSRAKHQRLRESDVTFEDDEAKLKEDGMEVEMAEGGSTNTLTAPVQGCVATLSAPCTPTPQVSPLRRSQTISGGSGQDADKAKSSPGRLVKQPSVNNTAPSMVSESSFAEMSTSFSSISERELGSVSERELSSTTDCDKDSAIGDNAVSCSSRASSAATLTNGCYSPGLSGVNMARVRAQGRHRKDVMNPRRVLRTSDLSLAQQEMELDYYDYEVNNAGAAPGSYLGMDPAFLVWIPPLDEGDIIQEMDEKHHLYEEILPRTFCPDPGSNTESPENEIPAIVRVECHKEKETEEKSNSSPKLSQKPKNKLNVIAPLNFSITDLQKDSPRLARKHSNRNKYNPSPISIQMKELGNFKSSPAQQIKNLKNVDQQTQKRDVKNCPEVEFYNLKSSSIKEINNLKSSPLQQFKNNENVITRRKSNLKSSMLVELSNLKSSSVKEINNLKSSPVRVHKKYSEKETEKQDSKLLKDVSAIKFADDNSDSSDEIQFMDEDCIDSNKIMDEIEVRK